MSPTGEYTDSRRHAKRAVRAAYVRHKAQRLIEIADLLDDPVSAAALGLRAESELRSEAAEISTSFAVAFARVVVKREG